METHIATRKDHRCDAYGKRIPIGHRYFSEGGGDHREHTNCELYTDQDDLKPGYNQGRK